MSWLGINSPVKMFPHLESEHKEACGEYFENLLTLSGVDAELNRKTCKEYEKEKELRDTHRNYTKKWKLIKGCVISAVVVVCLLFLYLVVTRVEIATNPSDYEDVTVDALYWVVTVLCSLAIISIAVAGFYLSKNIFDPRIKTGKTLTAEHDKKMQELFREASNQMSPLNKLFSTKDITTLIQKVMPEFAFDEKFEKSTLHEMVERYKFNANLTNEVSCVDTLSGHFLGNPFVFVNTFVHKMGVKEYSGSITIHWTTTVMTTTHINGRAVTVPKTVVHTEILRATIKKPCPYYDHQKRLFFAHNSAPDLIFSRDYDHVEKLDDKGKEAKIKKGEKELNKKSEQAIAKGGNYQIMSNSEFEVFFNARNRNHEVQFRLLYTPVAQQHTVELLTSKVGYGDDFFMRKEGRINQIISEHSLTWDMSRRPNKFYSYSVDIAKDNFISKNSAYFKSIFFDFAPLMCIPPYMETPSFTLDMPDFDSNYTAYEHECCANQLGYAKFLESKTPVILKTAINKKYSDGDLVNVTGYGYDTIERVAYVEKHGGDGRNHTIPVKWIEYIPIKNTKKMFVGAVAQNAHGIGAKIV